MGIYATVAEVRAQGAPVSISDDRIAETLEYASRYIDRVTGLFFEKRTAKTYRFDGPSAPVLELPAPCLSLTSVTLDGRSVDLDSIVNYNRSPEDGDFDDYWYPRLAFRTELTRIQRSLGTWDSRRVWTLGELNVTVTGDFGFVVTAIPSSGGLVAPAGIKRACILLTAISFFDATSFERFGRFLQTETMGNYSYSFGNGGLSSANIGGPTGDPEIDGLLAQFTRAKGMTAV